MVKSRSVSKTNIIDKSISAIVECIIHFFTGYVFGYLSGFSQKTGLPTDEIGTVTYVAKELGTPSDSIIMVLLSLSGFLFFMMEIMDYKIKIIGWKLGLACFALGVLFGFILIWFQ
jgi:hypothetical protein